MAWLRKTKGVPGSAPGGYTWDTHDDVVHVPDEDLATDLVAIPDAGFVTVPDPDHADQAEPGEPEHAAAAGQDAELAEAPQPDAAVPAVDEQLPVDAEPAEAEAKPAKRTSARRTQAG